MSQNVFSFNRCQQILYVTFIAELHKCAAFQNLAENVLFWGFVFSCLVPRLCTKMHCDHHCLFFEKDIHRYFRFFMTQTALKLSTIIYVAQMILSDLCVFCYADYEPKNIIFHSPTVFEWHRLNHIGIKL